MACRTLELAGVHTLATTLFSMDQAVLAAEVGCTYVAPYVNQLKVHFEPGLVVNQYSTSCLGADNRIRFKDPNKLLPLCVAIQKYFLSIQAKTQVLPASLTSTSEIYALAGVQHLTIAPGLLEQLVQPGSGPEVQSLFDTEAIVSLPGPDVSFVNDESAYRLAFTRDLHGASEEKLSQVGCHIAILKEILSDWIGHQPLLRHARQIGTDHEDRVNSNKKKKKTDIETSKEPMIDSMKKKMEIQP